MAIALEDLDEAAQAKAASLHPAVKAYLEKKAGDKAAAAADRAAKTRAKAAPSQGGRASASRSDDDDEEGGKSDPLGDAAAFERKLDAITPGRGASSSTGGRLITALFVGVLALEALSYILGQPFSFKIPNLTAAAPKPTYTPLYSGQPSPLAGHGL